MDRISICESLLRYKIESFLKRLITSDKKWITYDNNVRKRSWSKQGKTLKMIAKPGLMPRKVMLYVCGTRKESLAAFSRESCSVNARWFFIMIGCTSRSSKDLKVKTNHIKESVDAERLSLLNAAIHYELLPPDQMIDSNLYCQLDYIKQSRESEQNWSIGKRHRLPSWRRQIPYIFGELKIERTWLGSYDASTLVLILHHQTTICFNLYRTLLMV